MEMTQVPLSSGPLQLDSLQLVVFAKDPGDDKYHHLRSYFVRDQAEMTETEAQIRRLFVALRKPGTTWAIVAREVGSMREFGSPWMERGRGGKFKYFYAAKPEKYGALALTLPDEETP